jgi:hypothetical protein
VSQQHDGEHSIESNNDGEQRPLALPEAPANADQTTRRAGRAVLIGEVVRVTRACDPHDGDPSGSEWVIGTIAAADRLARYRFVGVGLPSLRTGGTARLTGYWEDHPEYGPQFRALEAQCQAPRNPDALARYIAANVPYCGPSRATRLIETFGAEVLTVLQRQPDRVREVFGGRLGTKLVKGWLWWAETSGDDAAAQRLEVLFLTAGGSAGNARRAVRFFERGSLRAPNRPANRAGGAAARPSGSHGHPQRPRKCR